MTKLFWNVIKLSPVVVAASFLAANTAFASETNKVTSVASIAQEANSIGQVTSVSQFSDVQPTDWAFQALQSLVERYGCIAGYPDGTYRGSRALTRYEFAAGLNACLDRINELIATSTAELATNEDLEILQRLQEDFSIELATLRQRVDTLEARTKKIEAQQFSTTTKLRGEAIFNLTNAWGDTADGNTNTEVNSNATFGNRVRLTLESSFTGKDRLQLRLNAGNILSNSGSIPAPNPIASGTTGTNMTRLGYDVSSPNNNTVTIDKANYRFNWGKNATVQIDAVGAELNDNVENYHSAFQSSGSGAISRYGRFSPIYRTGANGAGVTARFNPRGKFGVDVAYLSREANNPTPGQGAFEGDNVWFGQLNFKPSDSFKLGLTYSRAYNSAPGTSFQDVMGGTGSTNANRPFGASAATISNNYGVQAEFNLSKTTTLAGWYGLTKAEQAGTTNKADINYWAASLGFRDFGAKGNMLGFIFGQPPKVTSHINTSGRDSNGTSYHLETLYRMRINSNVSVTPGLLVIFNPEHNNNNNTVYVGTLRTTFSF